MKIGDKVKHKASFLKSIQWLTDVPKFGTVLDISQLGKKTLVSVQWCDQEEPMRILESNIMLAGKPDYTGM